MAIETGGTYLAPSGDGTGTEDLKTDDQHYRRCQAVHLPVPPAVRGTTEGNAVSFQNIFTASYLAAIRCCIFLMS